MNKKLRGKGKERSSKKYGETVPNEQIWDYFGCDANLKELYQDNQNNHNPKYDIKKLK